MNKALTGYLAAVGAVAAMTGLIYVTHADRSAQNVPMLYLLSVQAVAFWCGSRPAVVASFLAFLAYDWFYVDPRFGFTVRDNFEFVALCVFLITSIVVGHLTALSQRKAEEARLREVAASALARASWTVASEPDTALALASVLQNLQKIASFKQAAIVCAQLDEEKRQAKENMADRFKVAAHSKDFEPSAAFMAGDALEYVSKSDRKIVGWNDSVVMNESTPAQALYAPVLLGDHCAAVLFVEHQIPTVLSDTDRQVVQSITNHIAVLFQRDRLLKQQASAQALAETNRLKTALLQMVSHDFRSPLASIKASVSSLHEDGAEHIDQATRNDLLDAIESETDRLNKMVGNILDLSRLESGTWTPRREASPIDELISATLDTFTEKENHRINVIVQNAPEEIFVDPVQITQVLKNLLENALKYSNQDFLVELEVVKQNGDIVVRVLDRGMGLAEGEENRIFEPFYRAPKYRETATPGVGMGLAIARGLVEAHGATLIARSRNGGGAIFEIVFPGASVDVKAVCSQAANQT